MVKPMLRDLISLGNSSPMSNCKTGNIPTECAETMLVTNIRGRNPSDSRKECSSELALRYEKVAREMSERMTSEIELTKRTLPEMNLNKTLDNIAERT